jgi:hypothetical protein
VKRQKLIQRAVRYIWRSTLNSLDKDSWKTMREQQGLRGDLVKCWMAGYAAAKEDMRKVEGGQSK